MKRRAIALALVLAGCAQDVPAPQSGFRDQSAPIGGTTRFDPARFAGDWYVVAAFGDTTARTQRFEFDPASATTTGPSGRQYRSDRPGVLTPLNTGIGERLVIMWVDEGFRTAAVGHPSGSYGVILDRKPRASADRLAAAKDILGWYGWDLTQLKEVTQ